MKRRKIPNPKKDLSENDYHMYLFGRILLFPLGTAGTLWIVHETTNNFLNSFECIENGCKYMMKPVLNYLLLYPGFLLSLYINFLMSPRLNWFLYKNLIPLLIIPSAAVLVIAVGTLLYLNDRSFEAGYVYCEPVYRRSFAIARPFARSEDLCDEAYEVLVP